ncbi:alternative ribosome rescue aminoacyl-tRNA hydrolase ArfB [Muricoccus pecuniae]|uniref:Ribosome-associated protein n=1 Tax=Muricoccus pecuniae TaxID=693023 RepID=A0A840Y154_9PROT|nr:alternative ribosome rescue aminoacyl-tRNA hydrolase ArfB [Roseomonas pecuniae]MBB5694848.1 ribosome-associated protein [Roseomonas pecuniae]
MDPLRVTQRLTVPAEALEESFIAASGPGGQNVNKVATAVQLRLHTARVPGLPERVLARLRELAGRRMTEEGVLLLTSREHRTQDRNREAARARLLALLKEAAAPPPPVRRPTRPTKGSQERRLAAKGVRAGIKQGRGRVRED